MAKLRITSELITAYIRTPPASLLGKELKTAVLTAPIMSSVEATRG
jgi:hypothetical protein